MSGVTVTIITRDEAAQLPAALASVAWADERVVVDSGSTDGTLEIAHRLADRVEVRPWAGYAAQKNYAAGLARHDWILSLDADERVTPALAGEVQALLASGPSCAGYRVPRVAHYLGRFVRTTDWYPDPQLRLYDRRAGEWTRVRVHESVAVTGPVGTLQAELEHYPYANVSEHLATIDRYTTLAAQDLYEQGRRAGFLGIAVHPPAAFLRNYLLKGGIRDGRAGLVVSLLNSYYVMLKLAKLYEIEARARQAAG